MRCYKPRNHQVPVVELTNSSPPRTVIPSVFMVCEQKHVWDYEYNPTVNPADPLILDPRVSEVKDIDKDFHKEVFLKLPPEVGVHYDYFQSLFLMGYSFGSAVAVRSLIELFIRDNYGNPIFQVEPSKTFLHIRGDQIALEKISKKLRSPNLSVVMAALSGHSYDRSYVRLANKAMARYNLTITDSIWIDKNDFGILKDAYKEVSKTVHNTPIQSQLVDLKKHMVDVLKVLKKFFDNGNTWGVDYA